MAERDSLSESVMRKDVVYGWERYWNKLNIIRSPR